MQPRAFCIAISGLAISAALAIAQPAEPPNVLRITREDVKPGKGVAHEKTEMGYVSALSKTKSPNYIALETMTGANQVWFLEAHDSMASVESAFKIEKEQPLKSKLDLLDAQDGELLTDTRSIIAWYQKNLSYRPAPVEMAKMRFVEIVSFRVHVGREADFSEHRKLLNAFYEKARVPQATAAYLAAFGPADRTYLILRAMASLRTMDPDPSLMSLPEALGQEKMARFLKLSQEAIEASEHMLFSINPRMSNPPKAWVTADPDFWAPKPKPAAKSTTGGTAAMPSPR